MNAADNALPGAGLDVAKMPGHWLLARLGKRVLRPGGLALTKQMLDALQITATDSIVEFAPGLGVTAKLVLAKQPARYVGVERDPVAADALRKRIGAGDRTVLNASAEASGLDDAQATVAYCEAVLSMQPDARKAEIAAEAYRLLQPGGRFAVHELCLIPDDLPAPEREAVLADLSATIHVGARPLTCTAWETMLERAGFVIERTFQAPMHLLQLSRIVRDEGLGRTLRFAYNVARRPAARQRVLAMAKAFTHHRHRLAAIAIVARRP